MFESVFECVRTATGSDTVNVAPWSFPALATVTRAAVQLHEVADDGHAEAESAVLPRERAVRLGEALEHVRQERRLDPLAGVGDRDDDVAGLRLRPRRGRGRPSA